LKQLYDLLCCERIPFWATLILKMSGFLLDHLFENQPGEVSATLVYLKTGLFLSQHIVVCQQEKSIYCVNNGGVIMVMV